jgi:hypothetical protein
MKTLLSSKAKVKFESKFCNRKEIFHLTDSNICRALAEDQAL